jgi:hypothetical protein
MLRRYLISNFVSTAVLYAAFLAFVPAVSSASQALNATADAYIASHALLGPMLNRMISVSAELVSFL